MKKRAALTLVTLLMILFVMPMTVFAAEDGDIPFTIVANQLFQVEKNGTIEVYDEPTRDYTDNDPVDVPLYKVHFKAVPTTCTFTLNDSDLKTLEYRAGQACGTQLTANSFANLSAKATTSTRYSSNNYFYVTTSQTETNDGSGEWKAPSGAAKNHANAEYFQYAIQFDTAYKEESRVNYTVVASLYDTASAQTVAVTGEIGDKLTVAKLNELYASKIKSISNRDAYDLVWTYNDAAFPEEGIDVEEGVTYKVSQTYEPKSYNIYVDLGDGTYTDEMMAEIRSDRMHLFDTVYQNGIVTFRDKEMFAGIYNVKGHYTFKVEDSTTKETYDVACSLVRPTPPSGSVFVGWTVEYLNADDPHSTKTQLGDSSPVYTSGLYGDILVTAQYSDAAYVYAIPKGDRVLGSDYQNTDNYSAAERCGWSVENFAGPEGKSEQLNSLEEINAYKNAQTQEENLDFAHYDYYAIAEGELIEFWLKTCNGYYVSNLEDAFEHAGMVLNYTKNRMVGYSPNNSTDTESRKLTAAQLSSESPDGIIRFTLKEGAVSKVPTTLRVAFYENELGKKLESCKLQAEGKDPVRIYKEYTESGAFVSDNNVFTSDFAWGDTVRFKVLDDAGNPITEQVLVAYRSGGAYIPEKAEGYSSYGQSYGREFYNGLTNADYKMVYLSPDEEGYFSYTLCSDYLSTSSHTDFIYIFPVPVKDLEILSQPENYTGKIGDSATFTVLASGDGLSYQWYYSKNNGLTWSKSSFTGNNTETLTIPLISARIGQLYQCIITDQYGKSLTSDSVQMQEKTADVTITAQPEDFYGNIGETAVFTIVAEGEALTYQWYYSTDGQKWSKSSQAGSNEVTITIPIKAIRLNQKYRCSITDENGYKLISSEVSILQKAAECSITQQPADVTAKVRSTAVFTCTAEGENLTYQWYYQKAGSKTWSISGMEGNNTNTLSVTATAARDGMKYRCLITDKNGIATTTDEAELRIE